MEHKIIAESEGKLDATKTVDKTDAVQSRTLRLIRSFFRRTWQRWHGMNGVQLGQAIATSWPPHSSFGLLL